MSRKTQEQRREQGVATLQRRLIEDLGRTHIQIQSKFNGHQFCLIKKLTTVNPNCHGLKNVQTAMEGGGGLRGP